MHEAVHTIPLIKSNLSFNSNTSNSDQHLPLNKCETIFENGLEWDLRNPLRSICPQEIFKPQLGNFCWMDRTHTVNHSELYFCQVLMEGAVFSCWNWLYGAKPCLGSAPKFKDIVTLICLSLFFMLCHNLLIFYLLISVQP